MKYAFALAIGAVIINAAVLPSLNCLVIGHCPQASTISEGEAAITTFRDIFIGGSGKAFSSASTPAPTVNDLFSCLAIGHCHENTFTATATSMPTETLTVNVSLPTIAGVSCLGLNCQLSAIPTSTSIEKRQVSCLGLGCQGDYPTKVRPKTIITSTTQELPVLSCLGIGCQKNYPTKVRPDTSNTATSQGPLPVISCLGLSCIAATPLEAKSTYFPTSMPTDHNIFTILPIITPAPTTFEKRVITPMESWPVLSPGVTVTFN